MYVYLITCIMWYKIYLYTYMIIFKIEIYIHFSNLFFYFTVNIFTCF